MPRLGHSTDRRAIQHTREVFREDNVEVLMCFVCACKEVSHQGFDKFGRPAHKGNIRHRKDAKYKKVLLQIIAGDSDAASEASWNANLSAKRFKDHFGEAVAVDPGMQDGSWEWFRNVRRRGGVHRVLCCPEDVRRSATCRHADHFVCSECAIPICDDCYRMAADKQKIPRALANDNFIGYVHRYIIENRVTWLEATIACPVFSGLVTYYIEGDATERGHMMADPLAKPQRAWAVRGNIFSFLLPWEKVMAQLSKCFLTGDFRDWPLDQSTVCELVRVRIVRAMKDPKTHYRELRVRSQIVKGMANLYMERHVQDLGRRFRVLKLMQVTPEHTEEGAERPSMTKQIRNHIEARVDREYPAAVFGSEAGAIPPQIQEMLEAGDAQPDSSTGFDMKQATMPDMATSGSDIFQGVRPTLVVDEGATHGSFSKEAVAESAMSEKASVMEIYQSATFSRTSL